MDRMSDTDPRPLHLHTLESLCADLISGYAVYVEDDGQIFSLPDDRSRSALEWYRRRGAINWSAPVSVHHGEQLISAILGPPPAPRLSQSRNKEVSLKRRLTLKRISAHRFAGLHRFGTPTEAPADYVHEFSDRATLFEGANGSGKTSLVNAIVWALTGEVLRAQREPVEATKEFECQVSSDVGSSAHRLTPVTPLPDLGQFRPTESWIPADTWVELTFVDEVGIELPPVRRTQKRTQQGKLLEASPDLTPLGLDPVGVRVGTIMPGVLPLIRIGSESELGKAVSQLTGLSALSDLVEHVRRAKQKIEKEFTKTKNKEIERTDESYERARADLSRVMSAHPLTTPPRSVPPPSNDRQIEVVLQGAIEHFDRLKVEALRAAKEILGNAFDSESPKLRADLEGNIAPALSELKQIGRLTSMARLAGLKRLTTEECSAADAKIEELLQEANKLILLAKNPAYATRARLYAHIAMWMSDHPDPKRPADWCVVCGGQLGGTRDAITGELVQAHIHNATSDAALVSQTISRWTGAALSHLTRSLPAALRTELEVDLPKEPIDLIRTAFVDELFSTAPFSGVLGELKSAAIQAFDQVSKGARALGSPRKRIDLPGECVALAKALARLSRAVEFARWRQANEECARQLYELVIGRVSSSDQPPAQGSLADKLLRLRAMVENAEPITSALTAGARLQADIQNRRAAENQLREYGIASAALAALLPLGDLADLQAGQLRRLLSAEAAKWRRRIYLGAFPSTTHQLIDARMSRRGAIDLEVGTDGISASVQHVSNASALRASIVAFYLAFWEYVFKERGGLRLLLLDDPQELLDQENRERLADTVGHLLDLEAQVIVTTYDLRFAGHVSRLPNQYKLDHRSVHPATANRPTVRTPVTEAEIHKRKKLFELDLDAEEPSRAYADACRVYLEAMLGDLFEDPAYSEWVRSTPAPTLANYADRLKGLVNTSSMGPFSGRAFKAFVNHPASQSQGATAKLLNKAHHGDRRTITPAEVGECADHLIELVKLVDRMHEEYRQWRRRESEEKPATRGHRPTSLPPAQIAVRRVDICSSLAAFTRREVFGESQEPGEVLDPQIFESKALYYLRRENFGFAAPAGSVAIVEIDPLPIADRALVIARHGVATYARRLLQAQHSSLVALAAETPDPRRSPKTLFLPESEVALHRVTGIIFQSDGAVSQGRDEAVTIDRSDFLEGIEVAYRVVEDSAIPLALPRQVALGGAAIDLSSFAQCEGKLVAMSLDDGSNIFKRVGKKLPGDLSYLYQFESIGGLGSSEILAVGEQCLGFRSVLSARLIIGVLY